MIFWAITFVICGIIAVFFYLSLIQKAPQITSNSDLEVYKDQLINIDSELTRGIITADEGERIKAEVGRRILDLGKRKQFPFKKEPKLLGIILSVSFLVILGVGGAVIYQEFGAPGYANISQNQRIKNADKLIKGRATQEQLLALRIDEPSLITPEGNYGELVQKLRLKVAERPTDLEGLKLLTSIETKIGNIDEAVKSQRQFLQILGNNASDLDFFNYADLLINQVDGVVSPQADKALRSALKINPQNGGAKYYVGLMLAQNDRPDLALRLWKQLLSKDDMESPWVPLIRADIERLAVLAGDTKFELPTIEALPGPTSEDIENASEMSEGERKEMIQGMVSRLSERLSTEGGSPNEWARLINALGILGDLKNANSVWGEAKTIFKGSPNALKILRDVADTIGLK